MVTVGDLRGGRNGTDPPMSLPDNQAVEVLNMDWAAGTIGRKRGGADNIDISGSGLSSGVYELGLHVPGATESAAELWMTDGASPVVMKRLVTDSFVLTATLDDAVSTQPAAVVGVTLNGKRFIAYDSPVDRLHVYDPQLSSPRVRRVGLATPAAPTVTDTGSGSYPATIRYVRIRWIQVSGAIVVRRSEASPSTAFTPDGSHLKMRVTRSAAAGEGETHWEIEVSPDNVLWFRWYGTSIGNQIAIATTTQDDNNDPSDYPAGSAADVVGTYTTFPSVKYLLSDGNRLLGAGAWESGKSSRIYYSPVLGSTDQGDDERVPITTKQKNFLDLNENDGGAITGLGGSIDGSLWAFKYRQIWKLSPTGIDTAPYTALKRTQGLGCISHKSIVVAEDEAGRPAIYFMSHKGPYRMGTNGLQYLGRDNEDIWRSVNRDASVVCTHAVWHSDIHQIWIWVATGAANEPDVKMVFDVKLGYADANGQVRGGWSKHTGPSAGARCSTMFANTISGFTTRDFKPYIGRTTGTLLWKCDTSTTTDAGTAFQAYATTKPLPTSASFAKRIGTDEPYLLAKAQAATSIQVTVEQDFGRITARSATVSIAAAGSETRVIKKLEGLETAGASMVQLTIGDASAVASAWTLDAVAIPITGQEMG